MEPLKLTGKMHSIPLKEEDRKPYDVMGNIIAYEQGDLEDEEVIYLFQQLVNSGLAWQLQGSYGRMAASLIQAGTIKAR
jgi:hypothetical protein